MWLLTMGQIMRIKGCVDPRSCELRDERADASIGLPAAQPEPGGIFLWPFPSIKRKRMAEPSKRFAVNLKTSLHAKIAARAEARGLSRAGWVRSVIMDALGAEYRGVGRRDQLADLRRLDRSLRKLGSAHEDNAADLARAMTLAKVPE
jgi:hypothetical protein